MDPLRTPSIAPRPQPNAAERDIRGSASTQSASTTHLSVHRPDHRDRTGIRNSCSPRVSLGFGFINFHCPIARGRDDIDPGVLSEGDREVACDRFSPLSKSVAGGSRAPDPRIAANHTPRGFRPAPDAQHSPAVDTTACGDTAPAPASHGVPVERPTLRAATLT